MRIAVPAVLEFVATPVARVRSMGYRIVMGIFVNLTKLIVARMFVTAREGRHVLVCEIDAQSASPNAVIVPLPAAGAVERIDLREFETGWDGGRIFFDRLQWYFVALTPGRAGGGQAFMAPPPSPVDAGAGGKPAWGPSLSYVSPSSTSDAVELFGSPALLSAGLGRAPAPRQELLDLLAQRYPEHVFALCRLPAGLARAFVAVRFSPRDPARVFFPLLQVAGGRAADSRARYAHVLYGQGVGLDERMLPCSVRDASTWLGPRDVPSFPSFVDTGAPIDLATRHGLLPNEDLWAPLAP